MTRLSALKFISALLILLPLSWLGCKKDKNLKAPLVFLSPEDIYIYGKSGDVISFTITVETNEPLTRLIITAKPDYQSTATLIDSSLSNLNGLIYYFEYLISDEVAGKSVVFSISAYDSNGASGTSAKRLWVASLSTVQPRLLSETTGHQMFSGKSMFADAYDFESSTPQPKFSLLSDSSLLDIKDYPFNDTTDALSKRWISPAGGRFVSFPGYDYANATDSTVIAAYNSGIKLEQMSDIKNGDIILTKLASTLNDTNIYAAVKIVSVIDTDSTDSDFYLFNLKK